MGYYHQKTLEDLTFSEALERVKAALKKEGFGILTEIDFKGVMQDKMQVSIKPYVILGACNPPFAYKAFQAENKIGTLLPCNVIVQEQAKGRIEVAAVDPVASMQAVGNKALEAVAGEVDSKLQRAMDRL